MKLLSQRLEHEEGVGQHDQGQMAMQAIPAASLILIQANSEAHATSIMPEIKFGIENFHHWKISFCKFVCIDA